MAASTTSIRVSTHAGVETINITPAIREALKEASIRDGLLLVSVRHTTCGLILNEDDPGLRTDFARLAEHLLDPLRSSGPFEHDQIDNNARAHLTAGLMGASVQVPFVAGAPSLGSWQNILLIEMDGPRTRQVDLTLVGG
jgi:secondary thiamine-phosphate synthase enzyme